MECIQFMEINSIINAVSGKTQLAAITSVLKKAQDIAGQQVSQLIDAIPRSPSPQGIGGKIDITA